MTFIGVLGAGIILGWSGHALYSSFLVKPVVVPKIESVESQPEIAAPNIDETLNAPYFFSSNSLINNNQLGMVIELIKQDLDVEAQNRLNKDVVKYARSLLLSVNDKNTEQRLLALLGNFDTKEQVLDVLARYYEKQNKFEEAITSLFNLRSMAQFDEDYEKITSRINVLTKKNIKLLSSYSYKAELSAFFEFMIAKEPDNFSAQMQYAEFEYDNRHYAKVDQLLSVLRYHPEYSLKSEALLKKSQHQIEMIENGIVPVPVEKAGEHYIVNAVINNQEPVKLIIDTGASLTILSPKVISDLGLKLDDVDLYMEFSTANGVVKAPTMLLDSIRIQNHLVNDLRVGVLSAVANSEYGGLLGMNFLNHFAFFLDQKNSTLELVEAE